MVVVLNWSQSSERLVRQYEKPRTLINPATQIFRTVIQVNQLPMDSSNSLGSQQPAAPKPLGMDSNQAARAIYPNIARSLQKYLRLTKQTGRHNLQSIYEHLSKCLLFKLSARTFLEKFTNSESVWQQSETNLFANCRLDGQPLAGKRKGDLEINSWSLICDTLLSRQVDSGELKHPTSGSL